MLVKRKTIHFDNYRMYIYIFQNRKDVWQKPVKWFALPDSYITPEIDFRNKL